MGLRGGSVLKNLPANAGDTGSVPGSGRSPGEGNSKLLQYSCVGHSMDRGAWQTTVHGVAKESDTIQQLNNSNKLLHHLSLAGLLLYDLCHRPLTENAPTAF